MQQNVAIIINKATSCRREGAELRKWLLDFRKEKGMLQEDIATICGISRQFYSMIELGVRTPSTKTAKAIANTLNFSWIRFFESDKEAS